MKLCFIWFQVLHLYLIIIPRCDRLWLNSVVEILSQRIFILHIYFHVYRNYVEPFCIIFLYVCMGYCITRATLRECAVKLTAKVQSIITVLLHTFYIWNLFVPATLLGRRFGSKQGKHCVTVCIAVVLCFMLCCLSSLCIKLILNWLRINCIWWFSCPAQRLLFQNLHCWSFVSLFVCLTLFDLYFLRWDVILFE